MTIHGEFNWIELQTSDAEAAVTFYSECIGWQFRSEKMPAGGNYWIGMTAGKPFCGILTLNGNEPDRWFTYVHIDAIDEAIAKVKKRGGDILRAPWDVPGVGRIAIIRDPGGADLGLVTPVEYVSN